MANSVPSIYAFESGTDTPCLDCIEGVRKWNYDCVEGTGFSCNSCSNKMTMVLKKSGTTDITETMSFGISKELSDATIEPFYMEMDERVHVEQDFYDICEKHNLGNNWENVSDPDSGLICFKNKDFSWQSEPGRRVLYSPFVGAVLYVSCTIE